MIIILCVPISRIFMVTAGNGQECPIREVYLIMGKFFVFTANFLPSNKMSDACVFTKIYVLLHNLT